MSSTPQVNTYLSTITPPEAIRRIEGNPTMRDTFTCQEKHPSPTVTTTHPEAIAMNQSYPQLGLRVVPSDASNVRPSAVGTTARLNTYSTGQRRQRNVLRKRRRSEASTAPRSSSFVNRIMDHFPYIKRASTSSTAQPVIGEPYDPVHVSEGPEGEDIALVRNEMFVGREEQAPSTARVLPAPKIPHIIITPAPTIEHHMPNSPRAALRSRRKSMSSGSSIRGPHLPVGDAWQSPHDKEFTRAKFLAPAAAGQRPPPSRTPPRVEEDTSYATHLHHIHSEEEALEQAAIEQQTEANRCRALVLHHELLDSLERLPPSQHYARTREPTVSTKIPAGLEVIENTPGTASMPVELAAQTSSHQASQGPSSDLQELQDSEIPAPKPPVAGGFVLPPMQPFRATMDFQGLFNHDSGELSKQDAHPHKPAGTRGKQVDLKSPSNFGSGMPLEKQATGDTEVSRAQRFHYGSSRIEAVPQTFRVPLLTSEAEETKLSAALKLNTWDWCSIPDVQPQDPRTK